MLLLDAGNSALKCLHPGSGGRWRFDWSQEWVWQQISDGFIELGAQPAWLASVVPEALTARIEASWNALYPEQPVRRLHSLPSLGGLNNGYHRPEQLGVDRWLAMVAVFHRPLGDCIIVDAGSAITVDLLSRSQGHLGGAILPGRHTDRPRFHALFPQIDFTDPELTPSPEPGRNTRECLHPVGGRALLPHLSGVLQRWRGRLDEPVTVLIGGQDAAWLAERLPMDGQIEQDLVFEGMLRQIEALG